MVISDPYTKIRHGEVYLYPIFGHKVDKNNVVTLYDGISIEMEGDFNDHQEGRWSAKHVGEGGNLILITQPLLPKCVWTKSAIIQHNFEAKDSVKDGRANAMTTYRQIGSDEDKLYKILLIFPSTMELSNKPFQSTDFVSNEEFNVDVDIDFRLSHVRAKTGWTVENEMDDTVDVYTYSSWIKWHFVDLKTEKRLSAPKKSKRAVAGDKVGALDKFANLKLDEEDEEG